MQPRAVSSRPGAQPKKATGRVSVHGIQAGVGCNRCKNTWFELSWSDHCCAERSRCRHWWQGIAASQPEEGARCAGAGWIPILGYMPHQNQKLELLAFKRGWFVSLRRAHDTFLALPPGDRKAQFWATAGEWVPKSSIQKTRSERVRNRF